MCVNGITSLLPLQSYIRTLPFFYSLPTQHFSLGSVLIVSLFLQFLQLAHLSPTTNPMSKDRDFNPHFNEIDLQPGQSTKYRRQQHEKRKQHQPTPVQRQPQAQNLHGEPHRHAVPLTVPLPQQPSPPPTQHQPGELKTHDEPHGRHTSHPPHPGVMMPQRRRTNPLAWLIAVFCTVLWLLIILGGLAILIVYLVFRPESPRFNIQNAGLNAAYLDTGLLLNADVTILANFSNPNKKVGVDFNYAAIQLYYGKTLVATTSIDSFSEERTESKLVDIHMISSEVRIPVKDIQQLKKQMQRNAIPFYVIGLFRTRSKFGTFLSYTYWLHGRCTIVFTNPPSGVLVSRKCRTKR